MPDEPFDAEAVAAMDNLGKAAATIALALDKAAKDQKELREYNDRQAQEILTLRAVARVRDEEMARALGFLTSCRYLRRKSDIRGQIEAAIKTLNGLEENKP